MAWIICITYIVTYTIKNFDWKIFNDVNLRKARITVITFSGTIIDSASIFMLWYLVKMNLITLELATKIKMLNDFVNL